MPAYLFVLLFGLTVNCNQLPPHSRWENFVLTFDRFGCWVCRSCWRCRRRFKFFQRLQLFQSSGEIARTCNNPQSRQCTTGIPIWPISRYNAEKFEAAIIITGDHGPPLTPLIMTPSSKYPFSFSKTLLTLPAKKQRFPMPLPGKPNHATSFPIFKCLPCGSSGTVLAEALSSWTSQMQ